MLSGFEGEVQNLQTADKKRANQC